MVTYPRRLIEREISGDSGSVSRRLNHLVLDHWLPLWLSHDMPLPVGLDKLILPFSYAQGKVVVVARNEGTTSCNLTHV